jgi:hypothetical protein
MASVVSGIFGGGLQGAGQGIAAVINAIKGKNPEDAAKLQELFTKHEDTILQVNADLQKAQMEENAALNETAGLNVRADAQSGDKFTSRARPGIIWVGLFIMSWSYVVIPMLAIHWQYLKPVDFPSMFWEVWGIVATGVVFTRTADKLFGGAGGAIQGLGLKMESKGDK